MPTGATAGFLVKLDPAATVLNYATLLGGSSSDAALAIALDTSGDAYLTGFASSTNFPTTSMAYQTVNAEVNRRSASPPSHSDIGYAIMPHLQRSMSNWRWLLVPAAFEKAC